jgi:hypothetical protein
VQMDACAETEDCVAFANCQADSCVRNPGCETEADCPSTQSCAEGICTRNGACSTTGDCPADQHCDAGTCTNNNACVDDSQCLQSERCDGEACARLGACTTTAECGGGGRVCDDGLCVRAQCRDDDECDDGQFCNGVETCDEATGCLSGTAPNADDGIDCTIDACDEVNDVVVNTGNNSRCDDDNICTDDVCEVGVGCTFPADNGALPAPGPNDDCRREVCDGGDISLIPANGETPVQGPAGDCLREICLDGDPVSRANDVEVPPQGPTDDCVAETCQEGAVVQVAADGEVPPQGPTNDCTQQVCSGGQVIDQPAAETPPQGPTNDCTRQVCENGQVSDVPAAETPPGDGSECNSASCVNGTPTYTPIDAVCDDNITCTVGTCELDGSCDHTPDDSLCSCPPDHTPLCAPSDPAANADGCLCIPNVSLSCSASPTVGPVLSQFTLTATPSNAPAGSTFQWSITGVPAGADATAQVLTNANLFVATFTPTSASAPGQADFQLMGTLTTPSGTIETCVVNVEAEPLPDEFEVTLFMHDSVDIDLHVIGGEGAVQWDIPFHPLHDPTLGDDPDRDCYFGNCPVCTVEVEGQPACTPASRIVDFSRPPNGASLNDTEDPQLDIDNRRGCFTSTQGPLCIPEKVTVETPTAGVYYAWPYYWGPSLAGSPGQASVPSTVTIEIEVRCRGTTKRYTRTLKSIDSGGLTAPADSYDRLGGSSGYVRFEVPTGAGACTLP